MVRPPIVDSNGMKKGAWSNEEDDILRAHVEQFGHSNWRLLPLLAGLARCGKSCRLRYLNYLKPGLKRGNFTKQEEDLIIKLHAQLGNKWSAIAAEFPGRTDNEIKNYWHAHIKKRSKRKGAVTKAMTTQIPEEEQSSSEIMNYCITTEHNQEKPGSDNVFPQGSTTENIDAINSVVDSYHTCLSPLNIDLPPLLEEELHQFGACQDDTFTFSDSLDSGITSWNSSPVHSQGNFWSEPFGDDAFDMVLW